MPQQYLFFLAGLAMGFLLGWLLGRRQSETIPTASSVEVSPPALQTREGAAIKLVVNGNTIEVPSEAMADIQGFIQTGQKIEAIKRLRDVTGMNLAAAKSVVASLEKVLG